MICIVNWPDVVGKANIEKFKSIQMGVTLACEKNRLNDKAEIEALKKAVASGKITDADVEMWHKKRHSMRVCGYERFDKKSIYWHGWHAPKIVNGELRFAIDTTQRYPEPHIEYITMNEWIEFENGMQIGEKKQYSVTSLAKQTGRNMEKPKARADIDDDFVPEASHE